VRLPAVASLIIGVGVSPKGIDYGTLDNEPVHVMVLFATPEGADKEYLRSLAQVMGALRQGDGLYEKLMDSRTPKAVADLLNA
jgi:mannitol/fructose-specific phosphotransferase system IIA component (Ntr-type)